MEEALQNANSCPFCGATKEHLDISNKANGHICVFCKKCKTYGPRVLEYCSSEDGRLWGSKVHWFKSLSDLRKNVNDKGLFVNNDNSEVSHDWYYEEAVRRWNKRA